jgi:DNA ligase-1
MNFPILYGKDKHNNIKTWYVYISKLPDEHYICYTEYGRLNGKCQQTSQIYRSGKNIGKSNETSIYEQCVLETTKKWNDKKKEGYSEIIPNNIPLPAPAQSPAKSQNSTLYEELSKNKSSKDNNDEVYFLPMLANTFSISNPKHLSMFPCFVQPKLDGIRCICYLNNTKDKVLAQSRTGNFFTSLSHITDSLFTSLSNYQINIILDGELYTNEIPFEELVGLVKQKKIKQNEAHKYFIIKYHVYDIIIKDTPYTNRNQILQNFINNSNTNNEYLCFVKTEEVNNLDEFTKKFHNYVNEDGYEGIMIRSKDGHYVCNYRSSNLLKYKEFMESEYKIVGFDEATGRDSGTVIWKCVTTNGDIFNVRPRGSIKERRNLFSNGSTYIDKWLTIIYQELSERNIPRFPVGKCIRDSY